MHATYLGRGCFLSRAGVGWVEAGERGVGMTGYDKTACWAAGGYVDRASAGG